MKTVTVTKTVAGRTLFDRMRRPEYLTELFHEDRKVPRMTIIGFREQDAFDMGRRIYDDRLKAFALKFDTISVHLMVESMDEVGRSEGIEQFTCDYDRLDEALRTRGTIPGELTRAAVLETILEKIHDGPDDHDPELTFESIDEDEDADFIIWSTVAGDRDGDDS